MDAILFFFTNPANNPNFISNPLIKTVQFFRGINHMLKFMVIYIYKRILTLGENKKAIILLFRYLSRNDLYRRFFSKQILFFNFAQFLGFTNKTLYDKNIVSRI